MAGISGRDKTTTTTRGDRLAAPFEDHVGRAFQPTTPNTVWYGDITYLWVEGRFWYLASVIDTILKADLILIDEIGFAPLDDNGAQLFFRLVAAAYEQRSLGIRSHWPFQDWGRFLPEHTTAVSLLDPLLHHTVLVATEGESYRMKQARTKGPRTTTPTT